MVVTGGGAVVVTGGGAVVVTGGGAIVVGDVAVVLIADGTVKAEVDGTTAELFEEFLPPFMAPIAMRSSTAPPTIHGHFLRRFGTPALSDGGPEPSGGKLYGGVVIVPQSSERQLSVYRNGRYNWRREPSAVRCWRPVDDPTVRVTRENLICERWKLPCPWPGCRANQKAPLRDRVCGRRAAVQGREGVWGESTGSSTGHGDVRRPGRPAAPPRAGLRRASSRRALPSRRRPALVLPDYVDVGADCRENDEGGATKMRQFFGITASPDVCEVMAR